MFKIFTFGLNDIFNSKNMEKLSGIVNSFLDNIDIEEFIQGNENTVSYGGNEESEEEENNFIQLKQYEDMYLLIIDLKGIDLRELSIRYDPGILEINLNRSEVEKRGFGILSNTIIVKKAYNKKFENIEEINTSQVLKSIDNGILSMRMPKKYSLENAVNIVDVVSYEDNVDN
jgi:HSP20 family protein